MPIDPASVKWDAPAPTAKIDPASVKWDDAEPSGGVPAVNADGVPYHAGALGGVERGADDLVNAFTGLFTRTGDGDVDMPDAAKLRAYVDAAKRDYTAAARAATPQDLGNPSFGLELARRVSDKWRVPAEMLTQSPNRDERYKESGPAAAAAAYMQGFGKPMAQMAAIPVGLAGGLAGVGGSGNPVQDALFDTYTRMTAAKGDEDIQRSPLAGGAGQLAGNLAAFGILPGASGGAELTTGLAKGGKVAQKLAPFAGHLIENAPRAIGAGGLPSASVAAQKTLADGGSLPQAYGEALASGALGTAQFVAPASLEGNALVRALSGIGIQQSLDQAQQQTKHAIAPEIFDAARAPDVRDPNTYLGALLGLFGGRRGEIRPLRDKRAAPDFGTEAPTSGNVDNLVDALRAMGGEAPATASAPTRQLALPPGDTAIPGEATVVPRRPAPPVTGGEPIRVTPQGEAVTPQQGAQALGDLLRQAAEGAGVPQLPAPTVAVDRAGNARTSADFLAQVRAAQADAEARQQAAAERQALGITPDIERTQGPRWQAERARQQDMQDRQDAIDAQQGELAQQGTNDAPPWWMGARGGELDHEAQRSTSGFSTSNEATTPAPRANLEALRHEIGWDQQGGRLIRQFDEGGEKPEVVGRTTWVPKAGQDGEESAFWRMRPERGGKISEKHAHAALDKYAAGQPLNAKERRFIEYATETQRQYDEAYNAQLREFQQNQADESSADVVAARQALQAESVPPADHAEALTLDQLVRRAHNAGADASAIIDATWDGSPAEQARRLWDLTRQLEERHGIDNRTSPQGRSYVAEADRGRPAATRVAQQEQGHAHSRRADEAGAEGFPGRVEEPADLFADPAPQERLAAEQRRRDAERNGLGRDLVRPEQGDGELLAGPRPTQTSIPDRGSMSPVATNHSVAGKQGSRAAGDESRRDAVRKALEQVVFHGTPHTVDKFSLQKIGTGEGAQAYGWGMYFASERAVAEHYRDNVKGHIVISGEPFEPRNYGINNIVSEHADDFGLMRKALVDYMNYDDAHPNPWGFSEDAQKVIDAIDNGTLEKPKAGNLYRVEVPEDHDLLDWDKPLMEQPDGVHKALMNIDWGGTPLFNSRDGHATGRDIYTRLREIFTQLPENAGARDRAQAEKAGAREASEFLNSIGIPGLRYLDGASRSRPLKDVKREFLSELPEDASAQDVSDLLGTGKFSPKNEALLKALEDDDWLGFDYPAQAVSVALGGELGNFDASPELRHAVADAQEGGTHNYVIWDESAIGQPQSALDSTEDQTDTPAFRKWFGDSKVVDAEGKPLVVYHGRSRDFGAKDMPEGISSFAPGGGRRGIGAAEHSSSSLHADGMWFGSKAEADQYAGVFDYREPAPDESSVYPVFLSIKNPKSMGWAEARHVSVKELEAQGYDGAYILENGNWVAFRPEQIKSATGNRGTFDPNDTSILRASSRDMFTPTRGDRAAPETGREQGIQVPHDEATAERPGVGAGESGPQNVRPDWTPSLGRRGKYEVDALVRRFGGSPLADSLARDFREKDSAQLIGRTISSEADVAALASVYRNPVFETARLIFVDDAGTVLGETAVSSRLPSSSVTFPDDVDLRGRGAAHWIDSIAPDGATGAWLTHNHPSANPMPSQADLDFTGSLNIILRDAGARVQLLGHVVTDHDTYGRITPDGRRLSNGVLPDSGPDPLRHYTGADVFDVPVKSPDYAAKVGKTLADLTPENSVAVVVVNAQGKVVMAASVPAEALATKRGFAFMSRLGSKSGAAALQIVATSDVLSRYGGLLHRAEDRGLLYDVIEVKSDGSIASRGAVGGMAKRSLFGKHTKAMRARAERGARVFEPSTLDEAELRERRAAESNLPQFNNATKLWERRVGKPVFDAISRGTKAVLANDFLKRHGLNMAEDLPPAAKEAWRQYRMDVAASQKRIVELGRVMTNLTPAERELVSDVMEKEVRAGVMIPEHVDRIATMMATVMRKQSEDLVDLDMLTPEAKARWEGRYLPRFYEKHILTDPWNAALRRAFLRGIKGSHLKGRGLFEKVAVKDVPKYQAMGWELRDAAGRTVDVSGRKPDSKVQMWRDFTPAERQKMGEVRDALYRFARGYSDTQQDIAMGRLFERIADTVAESSDPGGWTQVPDTTIPKTGVKRFGKLAGKWVPGDVLAELKAKTGPSSDVYKAYLKALSLWKEGKTSLNPVSHVNNTVSNVVMADLAGVNIFDPRSYGLYVDTYRDYRKKSGAYEEAREHGLFGGEWFGNEIHNFIALPSELKDKAAGSGIALFANKTLAAVGKGREAMGHAYQAEDQFFKLLLFKQARARGLDPKDAVEWAERWVFDYSTAAPGVRAIKNTATPFANYGAKAIPALAFAATHYPWRIAKWMALLGFANTLAFGAIFGDDDKDQAEDAEGKLLPQYLRGDSAFFGAPKVLRMPYNDDTGNAVYLDISRFLPMGDLGDTDNQMGGVPIPAPFMPSSPLLTTTYAMFANKDSFTGRDVVNETDTAGEAAQKRLAWIYRQMAPNNPLVPGTYNFNRLADATASVAGHSIGPYTGTDYSGSTISPARALAQTFGFKIRTVDMSREQQRQIGALAREVRELKSEARALMRNGTMPADAKRERMEAIKAKIADASDKAREIANIKVPRRLVR